MTGMNLGFSREGEEFSKKIKNFFDLCVSTNFFQRSNRISSEFFQITVMILFRHTFGLEKKTIRKTDVLKQYKSFFAVDKFIYNLNIEKFEF